MRTIRENMTIVTTLFNNEDSDSPRKIRGHFQFVHEIYESRHISKNMYGFEINLYFMK